MTAPLILAGAVVLALLSLLDSWVTRSVLRQLEAEEANRRESRE